MNEPMERVFADWLREGPESGPGTGLTGALAATRRTGQRPGWTFVERWLPMQLTKNHTYLTPPTVLGRPSTIAKLVVTAAAVAAISVVGLTLLRPSAVGPAAAPGIFAPVQGRIVAGVWGVDPIAVDPSAPSSPMQVRLGLDGVLPLGWSSDGTELLFMRQDPPDAGLPYPGHLYILQADGTETKLTRDAREMAGAAISPDGSRVAFAVVDDGLFVVDAEGGRPVRIADKGESPTFSPDGTQIAYLVDSVPDSHVWVVDADGSDAHEILANDPALVGVSDLAWSPEGHRIAIGNSLEDHVAIYTVAPDGSDFTKVITGGMKPYWSPDGSQIAYTIPYDVEQGESPGLAIADADGSNIQEFGFAASGPWHPGTPAGGPGG
jgi:dipeptidyl aminopeptidase/acylaminoacyl peptidase